MGSSVTPSNIRGFIQPLKITKDYIWEDESTFTEQNPIAGMPSPQGRYNLVVSSTGEQNDNTDITITTKRSGSVGKQTGATFTWRDTSTTNEHGHETAVLSGYEAIKEEDSTINYSYPQVTSNNSGDLFVVYVGTHKTTTVRSVRFAYRSQSEGTWTNTTIIDNLSIKPYPAICMVDDDTILISYYTNPDTDKANLSTLRSTDKGTTWDTLSDNALFDDIDISSSTSGMTLGKMSMSSTEDNVLLFGTATSNDPSVTYNLMLQFASNNRGGSFVNVGITDTGGATFDRGFVSVASMRGEFYISFIRGSDFVYFYKVPNPYYDMTNLDTALDEVDIIEDVQIATGTPIEGENTLFVDSDGTFYNINRIDAGSSTFLHSTFLTTSRQEGQNWQGFSNKGKSGIAGFNPNPIHNMSDSAIKLEEIDATITQGRIAVVSSFAGSTSINGSIVVHYYGGYTTRTQGTMRNFPKYTDLSQYISTWTPIQLPDSGSEYTATGGGTATLSLTGLQLQNIKNYTSSRTTTTPSQGFSIRCSCKQNAATTSDIIKLQTSDGSSNSFGAVIQISQTQIKIYDSVGAAVVGTATLTTTTGIEFIVSMRDDKVYVFYQRFKGASNDVINEYKTWGELSSSSLTNDNNTTITTSSLKWGSFAVTHDVTFFEFAFSLGVYTGEDLSPTTELTGRSYPFTGSYTYINGGLRITTKDSPAFSGDAYRIQKSSEYPLERTFPTVSKSPRVSWRSIPYTGSSGGDMRIAIYLNPEIKDTANSDIGGDLLGIYLGNINFHKFKIQYYNISTTAWVDYGTINTYEGLTFNYTREGSTVIYASEIDKFYLYHGEAIGWTILLEDSSGDFHAVEIAHNTEGSFAGSTYDRAKRPVIYLKNPSSTLPTTGEARLVPNNIAITGALLSQKAPAWAILIQDSTTISGDYRIGTFMFGPVIVQAPQYTRGRSMTLTPHTELYITQDQNVYTQKKSDPSRVLRLSWSQGITTHDYYNNVLEPDYYVASTQAGALPVASFNDVPYQLEGLYRYLDGAGLPLVYLPKIKVDQGTDKIQVHNRRESFLYGVTTGDIAHDNMLGDEMKDEVLRVSTITIEEIL